MKLLLFVASLIGLSFTNTGAAVAQAQDFPNREIKLVVGFPAGGASDVLARVIGERMSNILGQRVIVENRAGANGVTATRAVARSAADGYTLIFNSSNMSQNLYGFKEPGYQWDDFVTIGGLTYGPLTLIVNTASSKAKSLKDLVEFGRANPGKLTFASLGPQSISNIGGQRFNELSKIGWREVPYKGAAQVVPDLVSGNVNGFFGLAISAPAVMNQPNMAVLAVANKQRIDMLPNVPTFIEAGYPGIEDFTVMGGIWAPAGTPKPIVDKLRGAMAEAMKVPDVKGLVEATGNFLYQGTPEQFDADTRQQSTQYRDVFKKLGIQPE